MFGKFFSSTFTGSMYGAGVEVFAIWGYVIANTVNSRVELNPKMLSAALGTTPEKIEGAIKFLCSPDANSRSHDHDGRRLMQEGQFQYFVINHEKYRSIRNEDDRRAYNREKQREFRERKKHVKQKVIDSQSLSNMSAHTEAEAEADTEPLKQLDIPAWNWLAEYRKEIGKPYKKASIKAAQKKLAGFGADQMAVVEQTVANGWTGIFQIKGNTNEKDTRTRAKRVSDNLDEIARRDIEKNGHTDKLG